ncbi:DUF1579 domain-containing protein [Methylibium sp.]|uniref:DUF1579 domain-containing protein n=1 Tax=Methylibium sp. TaxID=2067992 RepID=UPI0025F52E41|nr:DUF1579 domain-containing protein [Methylibium sp.]
MMNTEPHEQHRWLDRLVGEWTSESEAACEPGAAPQKFKGTESVRALGGYWVLCEGRAEMPGGETGTMLLTLGYDPQAARYTGTWVGSMMSHLWIYTNGSLDAAGKVLTLESQGPSFSGDGTLATYRDVIEIKSPDHRMLTSHVLGDDGEWTQFMTANYHRKW